MRQTWGAGGAGGGLSFLRKCFLTMRTRDIKASKPGFSSNARDGRSRLSKKGFLSMREM